MLPFVSFMGRQVSTYALFGLVGFFSAVLVAGTRCQRHGFSRQDSVFIGLFAGVGLVAGGSFLYILLQLPRILQTREFFAANPLALLPFMCGMVFYGGLLGAIIGILVYCCFIGASFADALKLGVPVFPLAHFFMRIGCFFAGCCYGIPHQLGIAFENPIGAPSGVPLVPVQLLEALVNMIIFVYIWRFSAIKRRWQDIAVRYMAMYASARFFLEFLRGDERGSILFMSTSRFISVAILLACLYILRKENFFKNFC